MFHSRILQRDEIDLWTLGMAGLPPRVMNYMSQRGVLTVCDLRAYSTEALISIHGLGPESAVAVQQFWDLSERLQNEGLSTNTAEEALNDALSDELLNVIVQRYGLERTDLEASRKYVSLQAIGNASGRTRERVRQIEALALERLQTEPAKIIMRPYYDEFLKQLKHHSGIRKAADLSLYIGKPFMAGWNPASLFLLFSDVFRESHHSRNYFTTIDQETLSTIRSEAISTLLKTRGIITTENLARALSGSFPFSQKELTQLLPPLLEIQTNLLETIKGDFCSRYDTVGALLKKCLYELGEPSHYRRIAKILNQHLTPASQVGDGIVLKALQKAEGISKVGPGIYAVEESDIE